MTRLLYISVCLRTRQDTISYSFIYIVQKLGTVELQNCGTPKLWYSETRDSETIVLRNYGPGRDRGTPKLGLAIVLY